MELTITVTGLAERLEDVLDRVRDRGEHFGAERNGERMATIAPAAVAPGVTLREIIARVGDLEMPGDGFADDLEAVHAGQGRATISAWPD